MHEARFPDRLRELEETVWWDVDLVQVRGKTLSAGDLESAARAWVSHLRGHSTAVIVNDRVDVALAAGAQGAHLGQDDMPIRTAREITPEGFLLGASTHNREELLQAQEESADYAGLGAFFISPTKNNAGLLDPPSACLSTRIPAFEMPVLAIGGVTVERITEVFRVPTVTGVAVGSAVQAADDPAGVIRELRAAIDVAWHRRQLSTEL
jgi:thiamine-phosphate pyrophosphorylase